jgi:hypothetical protein
MPQDYERPSKGELLRKVQAKLTGLTDDEIDVENIRRRLPSATPLAFYDNDPVVQGGDGITLLDADGDWTSKGDGDGDDYQTMTVEPA